MNIVKKILFYSSLFFLFLTLILFLVNDAEAQNLIKSSLIKDNFIIFNDNSYNKLFNDNLSNDSKENKTDIIISEKENIILDEENNNVNKDEKGIIEIVKKENMDSKSENSISNSNENSNQNSYISVNTQNSYDKNNKDKLEVNAKENIKENKNNINNNTNYIKSDSKVTQSKSTKEESIKKIEKYNFEKEIIETIYKGGFFTIQIASFKSFNNAINLRNYFVEKGYISFVIIKKIDNTYFFRVNIGIFTKKEDALNYYKNLKIDKSFRPFIIYYPKNYF